MSAFLEVEDEEQRQDRIGSLLERLNTTVSPSSSVALGPILDVGREIAPGPVEPPTELLERVQAFLPAISASNEALAQQNPRDVDIENVPENAEQYIEMNLGLGVFEARRPSESRSRSTTPSSEAHSASEDATSSDSESDSESLRSSSEEDDSDYTSSGESSLDDDSDAESLSESSVEMQPIKSRPIKPLPRRVSQQARTVIPPV